MVERWKLHDSARTMTQKYNALVDEVNSMLDNQIITESTKIEINDNLSEEELDTILGLKGVNKDG